MKLSWNNYISAIEEDLIINPSSIWNFTKKIKGESRLPGIFTVNDRDLSDPDSIIDEFKQVFKTSFEKYNSSYKDEINKYLTMGDKFGSLILCVIGDVEKAFDELPNKYIAGMHNILCNLIKYCKTALVHPLLNIINHSLIKGKFPSLWKEAKIIPIHKSGNKHIINNYRPISILSGFSKVIEICLYKILVSYFKPSPLEAQHRFVSGKSTVTNLLVLSKYIHNASRNNHQLDVVYTDFSKAFDKLNIPTLINKINNLGTPLSLTKLLISYLTGRSSYVCFAGHTSVPFTPESGVPQGSNLGPLLFSICINDIVEVISPSSILLYADDAKIFGCIESEEDSLTLQRDLDKFSAWCNDNNLFLNGNECKVVSYYKRNLLVNNQYIINDAVLPRLDAIRDLGVVFDKDLTFNSHIDHIASSAIKSLGFITRVGKKLNNNEALITLYEALVRSWLEYGAVVWTPRTLKINNKLEKIQKKFLKFWQFRLTGSYPQPGSDYNQLCKKHNFCSLSTRRGALSALFCVNIIRVRVTCPELLDSIPIWVHRSTRSSLPLYPEEVCSVFVSPLRRMIDNLNEVQAKSNGVIDPLDSENNIKLKNVISHLTQISFSKKIQINIYSLIPPCTL